MGIYMLIMQPKALSLIILVPVQPFFTLACCRKDTVRRVLPSPVEARIDFNQEALGEQRKTSSFLKQPSNPGSLVVQNVKGIRENRIDAVVLALDTGTTMDGCFDRLYYDGMKHANRALDARNGSHKRS